MKYLFAAFVTARLLFPATPHQTNLLEKLPFTFEENRGQWNPDVVFSGVSKEARLFITRQGVVFDLAGANSRAAVRLSVQGASPNSEIIGESPIAASSNYLKSTSSRYWITAVPHFERVRQPNVKPGLDLVYYGTNQQLEFDLVLHPGFELEQLQLRYEGAEALSLTPKGSLLVTTAAGALEQPEPSVWQLINGVKRKLKSRYLIQNDQSFTIAINDYDRSQDIIIDPIVTVSTYLGGISDDFVTGVAADQSGNIYLAGYTSSSDFPTSIGAYRRALNGVSSDAFVTKLDPTGTTLLYSTFVGGSNNEFTRAIAVDGSGNAVIVGTTQSSNFPTTPGVLGSSSTLSSMFVTKINPTGTGLVYSTFLDANTAASANAVAVDSSNNTYVTGYSSDTLPFNTAPSTTFTQIGPAQSIYQNHVFVAKLNPTADRLIYLTYLSGSLMSYGTSIALDSSNQAYVAGLTSSADFPTTSGAYQRVNQSAPNFASLFVACLNASGSSVIYSTFLGGHNGTTSAILALDNSRDAYVAGTTFASDFPTTPGSFSTVFAGAGYGHGFITKLNPAGTALLYSTFLQGSKEDLVQGLAVDSSGNAIVAGITRSALNFPQTVNGFSFQSSYHLGGSSHGGPFLTRLNATGSALLFSSFIGAPASSTLGLDQVGGLVLDSGDNPIVAGSTVSKDLPVTYGALQSSNFDPVAPFPSGTGFLIKTDLSSPVSCSYALSTNSLSPPVAGASGTVSVYTNAGCPWVVVVEAQNTQYTNVVLSPARGVGSGPFTYTIGSSAASTSPLVSKIYVGSSTIDILQAAGACLDPTFASTTHRFPAAGGTSQVAVTTPPGCMYTATSSVPWIHIGLSAGYGSSDRVYFSVDANGVSDRSGSITIASKKFYVSQFGTATPNPGHAKVGAMQPSATAWVVDSNGSGSFDADDRFFFYLSAPTDIAVVGDWTGDGKAKAGVYRNGFWALDLNNSGGWDGLPADGFIALGGLPGDVPVVGDWNGDGRTKVGVYRHGFWILDTNGDGVFGPGDQFIAFGGRPGEQPVVGDWNGDGRTKVGFLYNGTWVLDYNGNGLSDSEDKQYTFPYAPGDKAVVGDWDGTHTTKIGLYRSGFWILDYNGNGVWDGVSGGDRFSAFGGNPGEIPVVGDWDGSGSTKIGFYNRGFWCLDYNGNGQFDGTGSGQDRYFGFGGMAGEQLAIGMW